MRALATALLFYLVATWGLVGCKRLSNAKSNAAKEDFAKRYSCPEDRVTVKERKDVNPATLLAPDVKESPPDEVKKDPGRLAKWEADRKEKLEEKEAGYKRSFTIFESSGCGHTVLLACTHASLAGHSEGVTTVMCQEKPLVP
jgi:hypothetical protein